MFWMSSGNRNKKSEIRLKSLDINLIGDRNGQFKNFWYFDAIYNSKNVFQLLIDFVITQGTRTFTCQSMKQDASLTLRKTLEKTEKRAKDGVLRVADCFICKKVPPSKNTLVPTTILENSLDHEIFHQKFSSSFINNMRRETGNSLGMRYFIRNFLLLS